MSREHPKHPRNTEKCHSCGRRYTEDEHQARSCPDCGAQRYCHAKTTKCRDCGHRFPEREEDLTECPECGEDRRCYRRPVYRWGYEVCQVHGAGSPAKGRPGGKPPKSRPRSYSLPREDLVEYYKKALEDKELLSTRQDIAVSVAFLQDILNSGFSPPGKHWAKLQRAWGEFQDAQAIPDPAERGAAMVKAVREVGHLIEQGEKSASLLREVRLQQDHLRRLRDTEVQRLRALHQYITAERFFAFLDVVAVELLAAYERRIVDPAVRRLLEGDTFEAFQGMLLTSQQEHQLVEAGGWQRKG